jgi:hypothetical protein
VPVKGILCSRISKAGPDLHVGSLA